MVTEGDNPTGQDTAAAPPAGDSIDAALAAAYDELSAVESDVRSDGRDARGRFATTREMASADPAQAGQAAPQAHQQPAEAAAADDTPASWRGRRAGVWASMTPEQRQAAAERETEMARGVERFGGLAQYADQAERNGLSLAQVMGNYIEAERQLATDFVGGVRYLCQQFGIEPAQLAVALGAGAQPAQPGSGQQPGTQPIQLPRELLARLDTLERRGVDEDRRRVDGEVTSFWSDKAHKHIDEPGVAEAMARHIRAEKAMGNSPTLKQAYEAAIWAVPEVRAKLIAEQGAAAVQPKITGAAAAATAARRASKSLAGNGTGSQPAGRKSIEDELSDAYDRLAAQ